MEDEKDLKPAEKKKLKEAWATIKQFLFELLDINHDTDKKATIEDIKENIYKRDSQKKYK